MKNKKDSILLIRNIAWAAIIFVLCAMPSQSIPAPDLSIPHLDKMVHFGMFFIMALLLCNELEYQTRLSLKKIFLISITIVFVYGSGIELLQHYFFKRTGDILDLLADVVGGVSGCLLYPTAKKIKNHFFPGKPVSD